jgi:hypothetical protein
MSLSGQLQNLVPILMFVYKEHPIDWGEMVMKSGVSKLFHWAKLFLPRSVFSKRSSEVAFTDIYNKGAWGKNEFGAGSSGGGSLFENATEYILFLQKFLNRFSIHSVVDMGCGDWGISKHIDWEGISYSGYDVVKHIINRNQDLFSSPSIRFIHADAIQTNLPLADLLICKDVMQHLPNDDIFSLLSQIHKFKHCLITNDVNPLTLTSKNHPLPFRGGYRSFDLTQPPFEIAGSKVLTYKSDIWTKQILHIQNIDC